ncbi:PREDICTED: zinc finger [Prunus dulcis]|nr:PREDICTED: zinc finger [Prunus dulcis]
MSKVAKDIFVVSISSVHSESAFSAGKKVVDPFRACLTPKTVEALICTNDWLRSEGFDFNKESTEDELELYLTLEKLEKGKEVESFQLNGQPLSDTLIPTD